jgi:hypothetical protein
VVGNEARWRGSWLWPAAVVALLVALFSTGCGTGGEATGGEEKEKPDSYAVAHRETIEDCLIEVGVQFAVVPHDIAFFERAQRADDVTEGGSAYDDMDEVDVRLLVSRRGGAKEWMLWYSQPLSSSRSPEYVVRHLDSQRAAASTEPVFVAFKVKPKFSFRREIRRCVRFSLSPS